MARGLWLVALATMQLAHNPPSEWLWAPRWIRLGAAPAALTGDPNHTLGHLIILKDTVPHFFHLSNLVIKDGHQTFGFFVPFLGFCDFCLGHCNLCHG